MAGICFVLSRLHAIKAGPPNKTLINKERNLKIQQISIIRKRMTTEEERRNLRFIYLFKQ